MLNMPHATPALRKLRQTQYPRVEQFADALGVGPRHLTYVEAGSRSASKTLFLLAGLLLGCDPKKLMTAKTKAKGSRSSAR